MKSGLFIVSYHKDLPFFGPLARSYAKFARGFHRAVVAVPREDELAFAAVAAGTGIEVLSFDDVPRKGFLKHLIEKSRADEWLLDCDLIFHIDSDQIFTKECSPADWLVDGKPRMLYQPFSDFLHSPISYDEEKTFMGFTGRRIEFDRGCYFWKFASDYALGFPVEWETMRSLPIVYQRAVYGKMRTHIAERFKQSFEDYVLGCRNEFPQTFCEFNALGGIAKAFFESDYAWHCISTHGYPPPIVVGCWSHGGLDRPHNYPSELGGTQTPRQIFERLGIA